MDIVSLIREANAGRDPERLAMKYQAMRSSPFAFMRGTCHLFYDRLAQTAQPVEAPLAWCCGDLHLENFGSYKGDNGLVYFDMNDFDEGALGPASCDLVRFLASVFVGAADLGINGGRVSSLATAFLDSYADALAQGKARWVERETAAGIVKKLLDQLRLRKRVSHLNSRTRLEGGRRQFLNDGRKTLPADDADRTRIAGVIEAFAATQPNPDFFRVLDVSRRIAGTGSLGVSRYVVLVEGKGSPDQNYLLDLKRANGSSIGRHFPAIQPVWPDQAARVVEIERRLQAVPVAFLHSILIDADGYVLRALQPSQDKLPLAGFRKDDGFAEAALTVMGQCVAWAQLRSSGRQHSATADELIAFGSAQTWRAPLLDLAVSMAKQVSADWETYSDAYDRGEMKTGA